MAYAPLSSLSQYIPNSSTVAPISSYIPKTSTTTSSISTAPTMGTQATSPQTNIPKTTNTLPSSQTYSGGSIVDYLGSKGQASDFGTRSKLATQYGISNYTGTADQNTQLLNSLRNQGTSTQSTPTQNTQNMTSSYSPSSFTGGGIMSPEQISAADTASLSQVPNQVNGTVTQAPTDITNRGLLSNLASQDISNNPAYLSQLAAYQKSVQDLNTSKQNEAQGLYGINTQPIPLEFQQGQANQLTNKYLAQQNALQGAVNQQQAGLGITQTGQSLRQSALQSALGYSQPTTQFGVLTNPQTGQPVSGNVGGAISMGANIQSIQDGQTKINNLDQQSTGAANNLQLAINIAKQSGINTSLPAANAFQQIFGSNFTNNPAYQSFQAQVASVKNAYASMGIDAGISDWNNISVDQLNYLAQTLSKNVENVKTGIQSNIDKLSGSLGGTNTTTGSTSGNIYSW